MLNPARNVLIRVMYFWREVVTQSLCPYDMSLTTEIRNKNKLDKKMCPLLRNYHT